ncbi:hypothetical protein SRHO_G00191890 [Serrasalmus rhombeus]
MTVRLPSSGHQKEEGKGAARKQLGGAWWRWRGTEQAGARGIQHVAQLQTEPNLVFVSVWVLEIIILLSLLGGFHIYGRIQRKRTSRAKESKEEEVEEGLYTNLDRTYREHH